MEKIMRNALTVIADFMPGQKTYITMVIGGLMAVCQMLGYNDFSGEVWTMVGGSGAMFAKMGMDRENPNHPIGTPTVNRVVNSLGKKPRKK